MADNSIKDYKDLKVWQKALEVVDQVIDLVDILPRCPASEVISKQILGSTTSVCANIAEGHSSGSSREFNRILKIAYREAKETDNWLQIIKKSKKYAKQNITSLVNKIETDNVEVIKMIYSLRRSIQKTYV